VPAACLPRAYMAGGGQEAKAPLALAAGPLAGRAGAGSCCRADLGPTAYYRAGPGQPAGLRNGPGTACSCVPGQPGPRDPRAGPDSCRVKLAGRGPGYRASGCMAIYMHVDAFSPAGSDKVTNTSHKHQLYYDPSDY